MSNVQATGNFVSSLPHSQSVTPVPDVTLEVTTLPNGTEETMLEQLDKIFRKLLLKNFEFSKKIIQFFIKIFKGTPLPTDSIISRAENSADVSTPQSHSLSTLPHGQGSDSNPVQSKTFPADSVVSKAEGSTWIHAAKSPSSFFQNLPNEVYLEIQKYLDKLDLLNLFRAFIIPSNADHIKVPTSNKGWIDLLTFKLKLLLTYVPSEYQYYFTHSDEKLLEFILNLFEERRKAGAFEQIVKEKAFFKLLRLVDRIKVSRFLQKCIKEDPGLEERLFNLVERYKETKEKPQITANALELLVKAGIHMSGRDFKGINAPGADLSYGQFDSTQLQESNLIGAKLRGINLQKANLSRAQMAKVQFDESPYLQKDGIVFCCVFSPDGTTCALGVGDRTIHIYNTASWDKVHTLTGPRQPISTVAYSPDGKYIASGSHARTLCLWDAQSGTLLSAWEELPDYVTKLAFLPNGTQIVTASGGAKGGVYLWDVRERKILYTLGKHQNGASDVACSPDGKYIASCGENGSVQLWKQSKGIYQLVKIVFKPKLPMLSVTFSPNSQQLAFGGRDSIVYILELECNRQPCTLDTNIDENLGAIHSLSYSPDSTRIAAGRNNGTVQLWDVESGALLHTFKGHEWNYIPSVTFSPDGSQIAAGSSNNTMRLWEVQKEMESYKVRLQGYSEALNTTDAQIQGVHGLSEVNIKLLKQKGAVGEPA